MDKFVKEVLSVRRYKAGYEVREEIIDGSHCGGDDLTMKNAYTPSGDWIGSAREAYRLCVKRGIIPEKSDPEHCVCSIGFCPAEDKWYGWSHRAMYGFGVGSTCKKGDCHYDPSQGEWTAETIEDAKQMAIDFAESVS